MELGKEVFSLTDHIDVLRQPSNEFGENGFDAEFNVGKTALPLLVSSANKCASSLSGSPSASLYQPTPRLCSRAR
jgi:hypothetical protein